MVSTLILNKPFIQQFTKTELLANLSALLKGQLYFSSDNQRITVTMQATTDTLTAFGVALYYRQETKLSEVIDRRCWLMYLTLWSHRQEMAFNEVIVDNWELSLLNTIVCAIWNWKGPFFRHITLQSINDIELPGLCHSWFTTDMRCEGP